MVVKPQVAKLQEALGNQDACTHHDMSMSVSDALG